MLRRTFDPRIRVELAEVDGVAGCAADAALLESVLLNIAINARDAMPDGGVLTASVALLPVLPRRLAERFGVPAERAGGYTAITVADTGCGMSSEIAARIFEPFFTTKAVGTGLGLSAAFAFVCQFRGAIDCSSAPGRGTRVTLYLPAVGPPTAAASDASPAIDGQLTDLDVMLVEDDLEVMAVEMAMLRAFGCSVRAYASAEHALGALRREPAPEIVISDISLGDGMRGTELADELGSNWPGVAVLLVSGHAPEAESGFAAGGTVPFLAKPFTRDALDAAMRQALRAAGGR